MTRHGIWTRIMARAIGAIAPRTALRWAANRAALAAYIGAGGSDHNANWRPTRKSADAILRTDSAALVARARSLDRNFVSVSGTLRTICDNVDLRKTSDHSILEGFHTAPRTLSHYRETGLLKTLSEPLGRKLGVYAFTDLLNIVEGYDIF